MTSAIRAAFAALVLTTTLSAASTPAFAWGCIAVSVEGTYGYSHSFDNEDDARDRALNECAARTTDESVCEITECDSDD